MSLTIHNLQAKIDDKQILKGVDLEVNKGEIHAIMGPNGSGKSTLANVLAGNPFYKIQTSNSLPAQAGKIQKEEMTLDGIDLLDLSPDERAQRGLFLAFQYPVEVPGVSVERFLREAYRARIGETAKKMSALEFRQYVEGLAEELHVKPELLKRGLNEGFSGGEKKRLEILQMAVLQPEYAILDETDSGLDIDAIKAVADGVKTVIKKYQTGVIIITHYQRILDYIQPDFVHVMIDGQIVRSGDFSLVGELESSGYGNLKA